MANKAKRFASQEICIELEDQHMLTKPVDECLVEANWTGEYPCLCHGKWSLTIDGKDFSKYLEDEGEMDTFGTFCRWYFDDNWCEEWDSYEDGLKLQPWIEEHLEWLAEIACELGVSDADALVLYGRIYEAIQKQDWRRGSCGGCI